jgi:hypothetical protein
VRELVTVNTCALTAECTVIGPVAAPGGTDVVIEVWLNAVSGAATP